MSLLLSQPGVWGWRARRWTQTHLKYGLRGPTRAKCQHHPTLGLAWSQWGSPWDIDLQLRKSVATSSKSFPPPRLRELRGTTSQAGEREQPLSHSALASLWRTISQIAFLWYGHLSTGSCLATALISCKALNRHQPGTTFNHCWPALHLDWQLGGGKQSTSLPQFKSLELSSPSRGSEVHKTCVY